MSPWFLLAELYGVETRALKQAVKRNKKRFPEDFMYQLNKEEWNELITNCDNLPENIRYSPVSPYAFTEQGALNRVRNFCLPSYKGKPSGGKN